ncbi:MAG TPA: SRPBCC family protein [Candidatus Micrarchaeia archaeon]|nr:SRPBCC family protein [Candidatus Micrarchaeia archaeon]
MLVRTFTSRVRIEAPRETVWVVLTDPIYVQQWQYGSSLRTDWSIGSPIRFTSEWEGHTFEQRGTILVVEAPAHLRHSLFAPRPELEDEPEHCFTMSFSLEEDTGGTRLTITHEDPREATGEDTASGDEGDNEVLAGLKSLAESVGVTPIHERLAHGSEQVQSGWVAVRGPEHRPALGRAFVELERIEGRQPSRPLALRLLVGTGVPATEASVPIATIDAQTWSPPPESHRRPVRR